MKKLLLLCLLFIGVSTVLPVQTADAQAVTPAGCQFDYPDGVKEFLTGAACNKVVPAGESWTCHVQDRYIKLALDKDGRIAGPIQTPAQTNCNDTTGLTFIITQDQYNSAKKAYEDAGGAPAPASMNKGETQLYFWLQRIVNILAGVIGLVVVISILVAGMQYMTAGSNASQVAAAKSRIGMAVLALVLFAFTYTLLQWLIPGGIF